MSLLQFRTFICITAQQLFMGCFVTRWTVDKNSWPYSEQMSAQCLFSLFPVCSHYFQFSYVKLIGIYAIFDYRHCCKYPVNILMAINPNEVQDLSIITIPKTKPRLFFPLFPRWMQFASVLLICICFSLTVYTDICIGKWRKHGPRYSPIIFAPSHFICIRKDCIITQNSIHNPNCCPQSKFG